MVCIQMTESKSRARPKLRNGARIHLACPEWLKQELEAEADRQERPVSDLIRERLAAPYRANREA